MIRKMEIVIDSCKAEVFERENTALSEKKYHKKIAYSSMLIQ